MSNTKAATIEVWLTKKDLDLTCREVHEDETADELEVQSLSMRGAQREMTAHYLKHGYTPMGRWEFETETDDEDWQECRRLFKGPARDGTDSER